LCGWTGPCEVVNDTKQHEGKLSVEWPAGRTIIVPLAEVGPYDPATFFYDHNGATLTSLMHLINQTECYAAVIGKVPTPTGDVVSQASKQWPEMASGVKATARALNVTIDGAVVGQGMRKVRAIRGKPGTGILMYWLTNYPHTYVLPLRIDWPIHFAKCTAHWASCSFLFLYSFSLKEMIDDKWNGALDRPTASASSTLPSTPDNPPRRHGWTNVGSSLWRRTGDVMSGLRRSFTRASIAEVAQNIGGAIGGAAGNALGGAAGGAAGSALG
jgi:hypothetical protein